tara:strand:+ start:1282 stop:2358 length:1077 start_codon:yes stop_codon:yes gene_type:complete
MKVGVIFGTRPEIIKLAPVIRELEKRNVDYFLVHTNQHYNYKMDKIFFEELGLPQPEYNLDCKFDSFRKQISFMTIRAREVIKKENPDHFIVYADPNSCFAGALAASKTNCKIHHLEAGLRSHDLRMFEEMNRISTGRLADYHYTPTKLASQNLRDEGIEESKIFLIGNTGIDSVYQNIELANETCDILKKLNLEKDKYFLVTFHRAENVDDKERLKKILKGLELIYEKYKIPIVYPIHHRTKKMLEEFNMEVPKVLTTIEPTSFLEFLQLQANTKVVITDSGGIQEESCALKVPCVTLRDNTERPETLDIGSNLLAGVEPEKILECVDKMYNKERNWESPFGDGKAAIKMLDIIQKL